MILTEKQEKYQHYHQDNYDFFTGEELLPFDHNRTIEQATFIYSQLDKAF